MVHHSGTMVLWFVVLCTCSLMPIKHILKMKQNNFGRLVDQRGIVSDVVAQSTV